VNQRAVPFAACLALILSSSSSAQTSVKVVGEAELIFEHREKDVLEEPWVTPVEGGVVVGYKATKKKGSAKAKKMCHLAPRLFNKGAMTSQPTMPQGKDAFEWCELHGAVIGKETFAIGKRELFRLDDKWRKNASYFAGNGAGYHSLVQLPRDVIAASFTRNGHSGLYFFRGGRHNKMAEVELTDTFSKDPDGFEPRLTVDRIGKLRVVLRNAKKEVVLSTVNPNTYMKKGGKMKASLAETARAVVNLDLSANANIRDVVTEGRKTYILASDDTKDGKTVPVLIVANGRRQLQRIVLDKLPVSAFDRAAKRRSKADVSLQNARDLALSVTSDGNVVIAVVARIKGKFAPGTFIALVDDKGVVKSVTHNGVQRRENHLVFTQDGKRLVLVSALERSIRTDAGASTKLEHAQQVHATRLHVVDGE